MDSVVCDQCGITFAHRRTLTRHMATIHNAPTFKCRFCDSKFRRNDDLARHELLVHARNVERPGQRGGNADPGERWVSPDGGPIEEIPDVGDDENMRELLHRYWPSMQTRWRQNVMYDTVNV